MTIDENDFVTIEIEDDNDDDIEEQQTLDYDRWIDDQIVKGRV